MSRPKDITGQKFGRLTAVKPVGKYGGQYVWQCACECGNTIESPISELLRGGTKSCGCYKTDIAKLTAKTKQHHVGGTIIESIKSKKVWTNNTSGVKGVSYEKKLGKWRAYINFKGNHYHLGVYSKITDAAKARKAAEEKMHDRFVKWYEDNYNADEKPDGPKS